MTIALVMCTYNGEKYILKQLESIYSQARKPDAVYIKDDCSSDSTVDLVRDFIESHSGTENWCVSVNEINLGWKRNFIEALKTADADIIFLADQDDIWKPEKIEKMARSCEENDDIDLLVSGFDPIDVESGERVKQFQPSLGTGVVSKVPLYGAFAETRRPGCTFAVSRRMKEYIDGIWQKDWAHDQFLWSVAIARGKLYSYNESLITFCRHEGTSTPANDKSREVRKKIVQTEADIADSLVANKERLEIDNEAVCKLEKSGDVYRKRADAIGNRNLLKLLSLLGRLSYYPKPSSWLGDLAALIRQ